MRGKNDIPEYEICEELAKMNDNKKRKICDEERKSRKVMVLHPYITLQPAVGGKPQNVVHKLKMN